jgi:hypothetical protein
MDSIEKIIKLSNLINEEIFAQKHVKVSSPDIKGKLAELLEESTISFENFQKIFSNLFPILEEKYESVVDMLISMLLEGFNNLTSILISPPTKQWKTPPAVFPKVLYESIIERLGIDINVILPFSLNFNLTFIPTENLEGLRTAILAALLNCVRDQDCTETNLIRLSIDLCLLRNLQKISLETELAYTLYGNMLQSLANKERYQLSRDLASAAVLASFEDTLAELGYNIMTRVYNNSRSPIRALCFAISLQYLNSKKGRISEDLFRDLYVEALKIARNLGSPYLAGIIFRNIPDLFKTTFHDRNLITNLYCSVLINHYDQSLPATVLEFLKKNLSEVESSDTSVILPWLVMLLRIKNDYQLNQVILGEIEGYIERLKSKVNVQAYEKYENALFEDLQSLKAQLAVALLKLTDTRDKLNFITENKYAFSVAHRILILSFEQQDVEGYLLTMLLKSDSSIVFKPDRPAETSGTIKFVDRFDSPDVSIQKIRILPTSTLLWLGCANKKVLPMAHDQHQFLFLAATRWDLDASEKFTSNLDSLSLAVRPGAHPQDYLEEEANLQKQLGFSRLDLHGCENLLIIKDIELSDFPHNLILNKNGFAISQGPLTNIMSIEWLFTRPVKILRKDCTKAAWIPLENTSFEFHLIASKLAKTFGEYNVIQTGDPIPKSPLTSNLNIVIAHGSNQISNLPAVHLLHDGSELTIFNLRKIIGNGDILILFVCHAGSQTKGLFQNQSRSVVKEYLQNGYSCVVAPFWALHVDIPPIWLPEFLQSLENGDMISKAVWKANMKVRDTYNTPKAYACLHLYGNPFLRIDIHS